MDYIDVYRYLKKVVSYEVDQMDLDEKTELRNFDFTSKSYSILPGGAENNFKSDASSLLDEYCHELSFIQEMLNINDAEIEENINFRYHVMAPKGTVKSKDILLLFHGFNEKYWAKYLPWAKYIVEKTGKTIVFFPIAFHMNRAPAVWSDTRKMYAISEKRREKYPNLLCSSLFNVAISTRLHNNPKRLIWSGLQTYYDLMDFVESIKNDQHPSIHPDAKMDIFSYSIGTLLAQIVMMTNEAELFSKSRLVSFCGGATFSRITAVSKSILDSEASVNLYSHIVEHLESHLKNDPAMQRYLGSDYPEGINFRSMLDYNTSIDYREEKFRQLSDRIYAIALKNDKIMRPHEVVNTFRGAGLAIPIKIDILDYPYPYTHEDPFPATEQNRELVAECFKNTFDRICDFLK